MSLYVSPCLSSLFWVSSLAYPNLLGTKGYVVVVVVVVVITCLYQKTFWDDQSMNKHMAVKFSLARTQTTGR
jgi:hypothetical protein